MVQEVQRRADQRSPSDAGRKARGAGSGGEERRKGRCPVTTPDTEGTGFLPIFMGSREEVESGDVNSILGALHALLTEDKCIEYRHGIMFGVTGYDDDPRELFEIAEV